MVDFNSPHDDCAPMARAHADRGWELQQNEEFEDAAAAFSAAIEIDSEQPEFYLNRSVCRFQLGQIAWAIDDGKRAADLAPEAPQVFVNLGYFYRAHGETVEAIRAFERALALDCEDPEDVEGQLAACRAGAAAADAAHVEPSVTVVNPLGSVTMSRSAYWRYLGIRSLFVIVPLVVAFSLGWIANPFGATSIEGPYFEQHVEAAWAGAQEKIRTAVSDSGDVTITRNSVFGYDDGFAFEATASVTTSDGAESSRRFRCEWRGDEDQVGNWPDQFLIEITE